MPTLSRRRSDNPHQITWHVHYGDLHVGTIGERAGVPVDVDPWQWSCGFYPGLHPGQHRYGTAPTFEEARAGFEADWKALLREIPEGAFEEYRQDRESRAEMRAIQACGEKLPSEVFSLIMRCVCGVRFDSHKPTESYRSPRAHLRRPKQGIHWWSLPSLDLTPTRKPQWRNSWRSPAPSTRSRWAYPIEKINGPFLFEHGGKPAEYTAGMTLAIERGLLWKHESGTYVKFTQAGAELFAWNTPNPGSFLPPPLALRLSFAPSRPSRFPA
jgi:hypothetical protein